MNILVVEDDLGLAETIILVLVELDHDVAHAETLAATIQAIGGRRFDLVVLDVNLGQDTTWDVARRLSKEHCPYFFASGSNKETIPQDLKGCAFLEKPYTLASFSSMVASFCVQ